MSEDEDATIKKGPSESLKKSIIESLESSSSSFIMSKLYESLLCSITREIITTKTRNVVSLVLKTTPLTGLCRVANSDRYGIPRATEILSGRSAGLTSLINTSNATYVDG